MTNKPVFFMPKFGMPLQYYSLKQISAGSMTITKEVGVPVRSRAMFTTYDDGELYGVGSYTGGNLLKDEHYFTGGRFERLSERLSIENSQSLNPMGFDEKLTWIATETHSLWMVCATQDKPNSLVIVFEDDNDAVLFKLKFG